MIITDIMDKIYPVQSSSGDTRRMFEELESRLSKWLIELPEHLQLPSSTNDKRATVLPHILMLHIEYHAAVLLLHRALCVVLRILSSNELTDIRTACLRTTSELHVIEILWKILTLSSGRICRVILSA